VIIESLAILADQYFTWWILSLGCIFFILFMIDSIKQSKSFKKGAVIFSLVYVSFFLFLVKNNADFKMNLNEQMCHKIGLKIENCTFLYSFHQDEMTAFFLISRDNKENDSLFLEGNKVSFKRKENLKRYFKIYLMNKKPTSKDDLADLYETRFSRFLSKYDFKKFATDFVNYQDSSGGN